MPESRILTLSALTPFGTLLYASFMARPVAAVLARALDEHDTVLVSAQHVTASEGFFVELLQELAALSGEDALCRLRFANCEPSTAAALERARACVAVMG